MKSASFLTMWKLVLIGLCWFPFLLCDDISNDVFGTTRVCCPAAFGHFNGDKLTDVFIIEQKSDHTYSVSMLISHNSPPLLRHTGPSCEFKDLVVSMVPADYDGDGDMDVLIVSLPSGSLTYKGYILWGNSSSWKCPSKEDNVMLFKSQPLLMDYNGDMIADLFGANEKNERVFWKFGTNRKVAPTMIKMQPSANQSMQNLSISGGHAFVDLDQDLSADLWVTTEQYFEFWPSSNKYEEFEIIQYPTVKEDASMVGQSTFMDFDLDGNIELLLPLCNAAKCYLYIYEFGNVKKWYDLQVNLKDSNDVVWTLHNKAERKYKYTTIITPRVGDFNLDGYPDVLITVFDAKAKPKVILLENIECKVQCPYPRTLIPKWNVFDEFPNSVLGTFFDFNEDGTLDVLLVNTSTNGEKYTIGAFKNPVEYDATFVKVIVLTGKCYYNCSLGNGPHGTNQPGPSITYSITTATGGVQKSCATQMSQSSHYSLQLPFTIFGLGRNWNFVDHMIIGLPLPLSNAKYNSAPEIEDRSSEPHFLRRSFNQIIPNSQLVVVPYPIWEPEEWVHKLFITPSKAMIMTGGALIATCLLVALIIALLHYFDKKEDRKERLQEAQRFHFVAM